MDRIGAQSLRWRKPIRMAAALVLLGAVCFTLVAAYQWAGRLGIFGEATTLARAIGKATFGKATSGTPYSLSSSGWFGFTARKHP
jgi:hypothetical protein